MENTLENLLINKSMSVREAMRVIDRGACRIALMVEDGIFKGTLSDGDVRRYLISGGDIDANVCVIINYGPKYVLDGGNEDYQQIMLDNFIQVLPIVDKNMRLVRLETLKGKQVIGRKIRESVPVVMMAGGLGTRLKPYTDIIPKPLIPIGNKTITEHIFDRFASYGCDEYYMVLNYKKSLIEAYFNDIEKYHNLNYIEEPYFMGTAGGMKLLDDTLKSNFFLVNCDILVDYDYYSIWNKHVEMNDIVTIIAAKKRISVPYGTIESDVNGRVSGLVEKPQLIYNINTGMYLCNANIFRYMNEGEKIDMPDLIKRCIDAGENVGTISIDEQDWYDMGQPKELEMMRKRFGV